MRKIKVAATEQEKVRAAFSIFENVMENDSVFSIKARMLTDYFLVEKNEKGLSTMGILTRIIYLHMVSK